MKNIQLYFLALVPPAEIEKEIIELKEYMRDNFDSKAALRSPPHITLFMPFRYNAEKENELCESLVEFSQKQEPFKTELMNFGAFPPRVIFVDVEMNEELKTLQFELTRWMRTKIKIQTRDNPNRPFHPHMTIGFRDLKKLQFHQAWDIFKDKKIRYEFMVRGFYLLKHDGKIWQKFQFIDFNSQT